VDRRTLLRSGLLAGMLSQADAGREASGAGEAAQGAGLPARKFGKTGWTLPILGYGGAGLPKAWRNPLSTEERVELVRYAHERGIRYFDTAGNYMESQAILGEALEGVRRTVYLVTKVETTEPAEVRRAVENSMKELRTDYLDAVLIHGSPGLEQMSAARAMEIHRELAKLRDEGMIHRLGLSAHGYFEKALALIDSGGFDLCMLSYGYLPRGDVQIHSARMIALRDACLARAHELGMGIAAMKVVGAGLLGVWAPYVVPGYDRARPDELAGAAIRHVLADERIDLLVIGMRLKSEIDANIQTLLGDHTYTSSDRSLLAAYCAKLHESEVIRKMRIE
jgi:predicted aldo/keto reductase-like oxidoreductase